MQTIALAGCAVIAAVLLSYCSIICIILLVAMQRVVHITCIMVMLGTLVAADRIHNTECIKYT